MRLVLDTNVLISATINRDGAPRRLLDRWLMDADYELVVSAQLLDELADVLRRPKLATLISPAEAEALLTKLRADAATFADTVDPPAIVRDPEDDFVLALAAAAGADAVVFGDSDLLEGENPPVPIWTVEQAIARLPA